MTARRAAGLRAAWPGVAGLGAAALLRSSFAAKAGSARFYLLTASLAGTWTSGALSAGPIPWHGDGWRTHPASTARALIVVPIVTGAAPSPRSMVLRGPPAATAPRAAPSPACCVTLTPGQPR